MNLYTAPALMAGSISIIGIILLIFFFNGKITSQNSRKDMYSIETESNGNIIPLKDTNLDENEDSRRNSIIRMASISQRDSDLLNISNLPLDSVSDTNSEPEITYNISAILILIFTKAVGELILLNFSTIIPLYIMTAFQWSSADVVKMQSIMMGITGTLIILSSSAFVFLKLGTK